MQERAPIGKVLLFFVVLCLIAWGITKSSYGHEPIDKQPWAEGDTVTVQGICSIQEPLHRHAQALVKGDADTAMLALAVGMKMGVCSYMPNEVQAQVMFVGDVAYQMQGHDFKIYGLSVEGLDFIVYSIIMVHGRTYHEFHLDKA